MAAAPDGNIMDGSVYAVFKSNKKLGGDFDQFERDHEPMMQIRAYEQQYHVGSYKLTEALKKLEPLEDAETHPTMAELKPELEHRMAMITDAKGLKAKAKKGLDKLKYLSTKADQEAADMRKKISDHIASVFPAVKEDLIKIEAHISGEITRLIQENGKLHRENANLILSAGNANSMDQFRTFLAEELKKAEATSRQDTEEVKRLRGIEVEYLADGKTWDRERKRLEDELNSKMTALDKVQGEKAEQEAENAQLARELREQRSLTKDANDKLQSLEVRKEDVDGKLADAVEKARSEEFRANGLSLDLENALETCRERQEKIDTLTSRLEAPRPVDADGKARIAMRAMQTEIDTHQEKTEKWKRQIQQAKDAQSSAETKLSQSEEQVKTLKGDLAFVKAEKIILDDQIKQLTHNSETSSAEMAKLQSVISEKNSNIGKLERQLQRMTNDFEWAKLRWNEYYGLQYRSTQEIQQLQTTNKEFLESLESKCEELRSKEAALASKGNRITQLRDEKKSLALSLDGANNLVDTLRTELNAVVTEKDALQKEKNTWTTEKAKKDKLIGDLEETKTKLENEKNEWLKEKKDLTDSKTSWKKLADDLQGEKTAWQQEKEQLKNSVTTWKDKFENGQTTWNNEKKKLDEAVQDSKTELLNGQSAWSKERENLEQSGRTWQISAERLENEKTAWQEERTELRRSREAWENSAGNLDREKRALEESLRKTIEAWHEDQDDWNDEKRAFQLHLDGTSNAANDLHAQNAALLQRFQQLHGLFVGTTAERDRANADLVTRTNERDAVQNDLATTTTERDTAVCNLTRITNERDLVQTELDSVKKERDRTQANLTARTSERDTALVSLERVNKEKDATEKDLLTRTKERDNAQGNLEIVTREKDHLGNELQLANETADELREKVKDERRKLADAEDEYRELHRKCEENLVEQYKLEEEHEELQKVCDSKVDGEVHRQLQELCMKKIDPAVHQQLQIVCNSRVDPEVHRNLQELCNSKVDPEIHLDLQKICKSKVDQSEHNKVQQQLQTLQTNFNSNHANGACVTKNDFDQLQREFNELKMDHSSCPDKELFAALQQLQAEHDRGRWIKTTVRDSLQQRFDTMKQEHSSCPDPMRFEEMQLQLEQLNTSHGDGNCVAKGAFSDLEERFKKREQCPSDEELQRLRVESQHLNCVDRTSHDGLVAEHQQCASTDEVRSLRDIQTQHQQCLSFNEVEQLRGVQAQHQQCPRADEVRQLQDFHEQHGNCVDRGAYDDVFNAHQGCDSIRREFEIFKIAHENCDAIAEQLGQLQEVHNQCGTTRPETPTYTSPYLRGPSPTTPGGNITTGIGSLRIGGFQIPGTPRSRTRSTTNAGTVGREAASQSPASAGTFGQGISAQSSPTAGTFGPAIPQPVVRQYSFLISGDVPTGTRTLAVDPSIIQMMDAQVARWENNTAWATSWKANTTTSRRRCSETRVLGLNRQRSPYVDNPTTACAYCVKSGKLCVINGVHGPVVMPLPVSERSAGATPLAGDFFVKR